MSDIYNGVIFPMLNHAKIFESILDVPSSSAVGQITRAVINTSNEVPVTTRISNL